jgi:hypothetical protein
MISFLCLSAHLMALPILTASFTATLHQSILSPSSKLSAFEIQGCEEAYAIIDACAISGKPHDDLFGAVHFIEHNAYRIYPDLDHKMELWEGAHGSWKLQLSTGGMKTRSFHQPPKYLPFSFAMIDEHHFGNGIGWNENNIWLALLDNHYYDVNHRRLVVTVGDVYLFGHCVSKFLPAFLRESLAKEPGDYKDKPPPTFVLIGCSKHSLIARGNQSGGLALWTRLSQDVRRVAYNRHDEDATQTTSIV